MTHPRPGSRIATGLLVLAGLLALPACDDDAEQELVENVEVNGVEPEELIEELEGVDLSGLGGAERRLFIRQVNDLLSPCGDPVSVARCIDEGRECADCVHAASYVKRLVGEGFERHEIRELYRLLVPGGVLRLSTPDLALYMCGYVRPPAGLRRHRHFLRSHGNRFAPDRAYQLGDEYISDASVVNNIFRNYGHQHVYDFEEFLRAAQLAGVNASAVCRSDLEARGLPPPLRRAVRRATEPANGSLACWLDQKVRSDESLYVHLQKGEAWPQPHRTGVDQNGRAPFCQPVPGDWGPCII